MAVDTLDAPLHVVEHVGDRDARCGVEVRGRGPYCWSRYVAVLTPRQWCTSCVMVDPDRERLCVSCRQYDVLTESGLCPSCVRDRRGD